MEKMNVLRRHGLFDQSVPRYTSYPPANHFVVDLGRRKQAAWLRALPEGSDVSLYVHIPFCRRLCWFCACRTQGTQTLAPVEGYVQALKKEIALVRATLPHAVRMTRLHLGGGTPSLLPPLLMRRLLNAIFAAFPIGHPFEFSVEIDPTDVSDGLIPLLGSFGLTRASIGIQDFAPKVQEAIGRKQSIDQTESVVRQLRALNLDGINFDLLYGLPHQTAQSFMATLDKALALHPDRLAIYGYAHVPWMSKRQVLIPENALPRAEARFGLAELARERFTAEGFASIGIDHFARPTDGLAKAQRAGRLRRNFQGYTDDQAPALIGLGASAISRLPGGYVQNAVATSAYLQRIRSGTLAGHKGYDMTPMDHFKAAVVEDILCRFEIDPRALRTRFPEASEAISGIVRSLSVDFADVLEDQRPVLKIREAYWPLARIMARHVDDHVQNGTAHSTAI